MSRNCMPPVINSRSIWYWAHVEPSASVMDAAVEAGRLGIQRRPSGLSGGWKKTKAGSTDFGGYSDNSSAIWWEQQRMDLRLVVMRLPAHLRAIGMVLYAEYSRSDLMLAHNYIHRAALRIPVKRGQRGKIFDLTYCALCQYRDSISPTIEGDTSRSMQPDLKALKTLMADRGRSIETRRWGEEWRGVWESIIDEIRSADRCALAPVEDWIQEYFERRAGVMA